MSAVYNSTGMLYTYINWMQWDLQNSAADSSILYVLMSTFSAENLPRLQPRFYSAASSPLVARQQFKIVFSVTELPDRVWNSQKRCVCGGWGGGGVSGGMCMSVCVGVRRYVQ